MYKMKILIILFFSFAAMTFATGFGFGGGNLNDAVKGATDCKGKKKNDCAKKIAITAAAVALTKMVIDVTSKRTKTEKTVIDKYIKEHGSLPDKPKLQDYNVVIKPGEVVKRGNKVILTSVVLVIPAKNKGVGKIEQKLDVFDAEKPKDVLNTKTKVLNEKDGKAGEFTAEFTFTLPPGIPEGNYPIATELFINGKAVKNEKSKMQVVQVTSDMNVALVAQ